MKAIEGYLESRPILKWLSGVPLSLTDRPLIVTRALSTMSGTVLGNRRKSLNGESWLSTDEIQFLYAFLLRNREENKYLHVLGPAITHKIAIVYDLLSTNSAGDADEQQHRSYDYNMDGIQNYIDSCLDIFENKFLVFVCNVASSHWVSVVVINPFLVFDQYLVDGNSDGVRSALLGG
jgi:hypothetical protein